jgi:hypothetical protein
MKCPKCGYEGRSLEFRRAKEGEHPPEAPSQPKQLTPSKETQDMKLENSKYEKG